MVYIIIILLCILLSYLYDYRKSHNHKLGCFVFICLIFILLSGFRYHIGIDSSRYEVWYTDMPSIIEIDDFGNQAFSKFAPGYMFSVAFAKIFSSDFIAYQLIHSIYVNIIIFAFFWKNTRNVFLAVLIYFLLFYYLFNCEILRESLAVATFLMGWKYMYNHKWIKYYIFALCSTLFHYSAFITLLFPIFFLPKIRNWFYIGKKSIILICVALFMSTFIQLYFWDFLLMFNQITVFSEYTQAYSNSEFYGSAPDLNINGIISNTLKNLLYPLLACLILKTKIGFKEDEHIKAIEIMVSLFFIVSIFMGSIRIIQRFQSYLFPFIAIAISLPVFSTIKLKLTTQKTKIYKLSYSIWAILLLPYFTIITYSYFSPIDSRASMREYDKFYPYTSWISKERPPQRERVINFYN